ncbi:MAG: hypothetical protein QW128_03155 [Thermoprotei archaeon]
MIQIKAKVTFNFLQPLAKTIECALYPDNKPLPHDLKLESKSTSKKLFIYIEYNGDNVLRLFSTIDELIETISLTIKTSDLVNSFN